MANIDFLGYDGLQTKDYNTLLTEIQEFLQENYSPNGEEISFASNTPDGQFTEILSNIGATIRELLASVYNATDPSKCDSTQQDTKYQLNYLTRKGGSWTLQNIDITVDKTVTLQGLDGSFNEENASAFTISDDSGNNWYLVDTTTILAGTSSLEFRAQKQGPVNPTIGTITNMVTIVGGVISVINSQGYTALGAEAESDYDFRIRRERSVGNTSGNNADSILGNILALQGVTQCNVWDNDTNSTDSTSTPAHTLWVIVDGGANDDIAEIIYANKGGQGTRGSVVVPLTTLAGQTMNIKFDRPIIKALYIKFDIQVVTDITLLDYDSIKDYIVNNLTYLIGENAETSKITQVCANAMTADGSDGYALNVQISSGGTATASITSTGITSASVISSIFQDIIGDTTGNYIFEYTSDGWEFNNNIVQINDYGISYIGTPIVGDKITISYTAGSWTNYIPASSIQDEFVINKNRIYITVPQ